MNDTASLQPTCFAGSPDRHSGAYSSANYAKTHLTYSGNVLCQDALRFRCWDWNAKSSRGKLPERRRLKKGKCKWCRYYLFLLLPGKSLPLASEHPLPSHVFQNEQDASFGLRREETTFQIQFWMWIARNKSNRVKKLSSFHIIQVESWLWEKSCACWTQ